MTDLQKIRKRLHKEMEILVDRTVDELSEEAVPSTGRDGHGPHGQSEYGWVRTGGLTHTPIGLGCLSPELSAVRQHPARAVGMRDLIGAWPQAP